MKYLNGVLTVIAFCLLVITFNLLGLIPSAHAGGNNSQHYATIPINPDGSIKVKFDKNDAMSVDIRYINGLSVDYPLDLKDK